MDGEKFCYKVESPVMVYNPDPQIIKLVDIKDPTGEDIPSTPLIENQVTYTLQANNIGLIDTAGTIFTDALPAGICYVPNTTTVITPNWTFTDTSSSTPNLEPVVTVTATGAAAT